MDGITALDLWDLIVTVLHGNTSQSNHARGDLCTNQREVRSKPHTIQKRKQFQRVINDLDNVDFIPSNVKSSRQEALLYIFEDNEAVIKMIIKGRSPTMRHVSRTHRVALDRLFDSNMNPKIQIKYVDTKNQLADLLPTKGSITRDEWWHLRRLFNIMNFSMFSRSNFQQFKCRTTCPRELRKEGQEKSLWWQNQSWSLVSPCHSLKSLISHRNLLGLPANPPRFPTFLETESGTNCADPRCGSWFRRVAEQSPLTGYEPNSLIEVSSEYTPINVPSTRNSFNTDLGSVPTTIAASDVTDFHDERQLTSILFTQETEVSANPLSTSVHQQAAASVSQWQPASSSVIHPWQMLNVVGCGKLHQCDESSVVRSCAKLQQSVDSNEKSC